MLVLGFVGKISSIARENLVVQAVINLPHERMLGHPGCLIFVSRRPGFAIPNKAQIIQHLISSPPLRRSVGRSV
jgi:hypothetical protein